jgi:hypothetical protein
MEEAERLTKLIAAVVFQKQIEEEQSGVDIFDFTRRNAVRRFEKDDKSRQYQ